MKISDDLRKKVRYSYEIEELKECLLEIIDEINGD